MSETRCFRSPCSTHRRVTLITSNYVLFKWIHIVGVIALIGNVTVTAVWKVFADRTRCWRTIAFAQKMVTATDWTFTLGGILLLMVGGYAMSYIHHLPILLVDWLVWGQLCFLASGLIWLCILLPLQIRQARLSARFHENGLIPDIYRRLANLWIAWGIIATIPLIAALFFMIAKP